jgi:autotransporter-associated beta strand protein
MMSLRSIIHSAALKTYALYGAMLLPTLSLASAAHAVTLFWDADDNLGGSGAWDLNTTPNWSTTGTPPTDEVTWNPNDGSVDAAFNGPAAGAASYTVTIPTGTTINANSLSFGIPAGNVRIEGGTINISDPNNSIVMNTNTSGSARTQIIKSAISGTDITVVANVPPAGAINAFLTLGANPTGATNTFTGDLIFAGSGTPLAGHRLQIAIDNPTALPSTATVRMQRNISQLLFGGLGGGQTAGYTATFNNDIILNDSGSGTFTQGSGAGAAGTVVTLGGVISGNANLVFELGAGGGRGTIVLANQATYTGNTTLNTAAALDGTVRLGINNALPVGTQFSVNRGQFDMAGFNQQVAELSGSAVGNGFVTNTSSTTSTLTIDGNSTGTFSGLIGASDLPGATDNIALVLAPTNTGTLTLNRLSGNSYNGGTTINGGRLVASAGDPAVSATGTGAVAVNDGGTLGGTGGVGGPITVASGGRLAPGAATGNTIGTLTALNSVSLDSGSSLNIGLGNPGTSDRVDMPNFFGSFALTVPAAANSVEVNLFDPAGGAAGNGTYTLMSFQAGQYTGSSDASQFFTGTLPIPNSLNGATISYHLADDSNTIQDGNASAATRVNMVVTGGPNALLWTGANNGSWDTSTANFNNLGTGSSTTFAGNDNVTFDDTGANTVPVTVAAGGVQPNIVTINNSTTTYVISGGEIQGSSLGGGGGLFLNGTGPVTIDSNYTAAAPIRNNKSGTGSTTFNGDITNATSVTVNGGTLTLAGANTYAGNTTVNAGTLAVSGSSATLGAGDVTVDGGTLDIMAGVADAIANTAMLSVVSAGQVALAAGINEAVALLTLDGIEFTAGTYGSSTSGATNAGLENPDDYFTGDGLLTINSIVAGQPGDYNEDGLVDAADYVYWRKLLGGSTALPNDDTAGVGEDDYERWVDNFGEGGGGGGIGGGGVPEPGTIALAMFAIFAGAAWSRRRA